ncbi:MAG: tRNA lysidine(34) synthetase TilS, partial [Chloroflexota bacterium]
SPEMFRNRIRHELLPLLRDYNPQVAEALCRTARLASADFDFIARESARAWDTLARREGDAIILDRKKFLALPSALKRHLLRTAVESALGNLKDIEAGHIEDVLAALEKPSGKVIGLPEGLTFTIEYDRYVLAPEAAVTCPFPALDNGCVLTIPGNTRQNGWEMAASLTAPDESEDKIGQAKGFTAFFDFDKTGSSLNVRHRLKGDRFQPLGMKVPGKLNSFMMDARIPRAWRGRIPIVASPEQIIWVAGWRIDERVKVTAKTEKVLRLEFRRA